MKSSEEEAKRLEEIKLSLEATDKALSKQREEILVRERKITEAEKICKMKERELRYEKIKIDRLIKDANIQGSWLI